MRNFIAKSVFSSRRARVGSRCTTDYRSRRYPNRVRLTIAFGLDNAMNASASHRFTRTLAAVGIGAISLTGIAVATSGVAQAATTPAPTTGSAREAYISVLQGISGTVARDVAAYEKCAQTPPPFAEGTPCAAAPENVARMIDLQGVALDRLTNPLSKSYVGPPPADIAAAVKTTEQTAKDAYYPVANAMYSCKSDGCDAGKYRAGLKAAKAYAGVLATWDNMVNSRVSGSAQGNRVINGCEIAPNTKCPGVDLSGQDLTDANLTGADLTGANLSGTNFDGAQLSGAILNKVIATNAKFPEARMIGTQLQGAQLGDADFYRTQLGTAVLTGADLTHTNFDHTFMNKTVINRTTGSAQNFQSAVMTGVDATGANLPGADFSRANMRGLDFSKNTNVAGAKFDGATCPSGSKAAGNPARCTEFGS